MIASVGRAAAVSVAVGAMLLIGGCSDSAPTTATSSASISATPVDPQLKQHLTRMLLRLDQLPPGSTSNENELSGQWWSGYGRYLADSLKTTTYTPAACKTFRQQEAVADQEHPTRVGFSATVNSTNVGYTNAVEQGEDTIALLRAMLMGNCAVVRQDRHSQDGKLIDITTQTTSELPPPTIPGTNLVLFYEQRTDVEGKADNAPSESTDSLNAHVEMPDKQTLISLSASAPAPAHLDRTQFLQLLNTAVSNYYSAAK